MKIGLTSITAMVLVSEERDYMEYSLSSIADIVDEVILYTNSQIEEDFPKRFKVIAKQSGITDFSKMRNRCLEEATGDWILYLDIDEILAKKDGSKVTRKDLDNIITHSKTGDIVGYSPFTIHFLYNYRLIDARNNCQHYSHCRFFKREAVEKYTGAIHEIPIIRFGEIQTGMDDIFIWHFGHCQGMENLREKYKRAMKIEGNPFKPMFEKYSNADEYCQNHDLFLMNRPMLFYYGPLPKILNLW